MFVHYDKNVNLYPGIEITCPQSRTCGMQLESYLYQCNIYNLSPFLKKNGHMMSL